jgi:hypothetical protein
MRRGFPGAWYMAGLALLGAMVVGGREARAGSTGIVIKKGGTPVVGDPFYEYQFDIVLLAGSTLENGGFITVYDLPEIDNHSLTNQPSLKWGSTINLLGITPLGAVVNDNPNIWNITWEWNGSPISAPSNADMDLGNFSIGPIDTPVSPDLVYVGSLDGTTESNQGTIQVNAVPEPTSIILLLTAVGVLPLYARSMRRGPVVQAAS